MTAARRRSSRAVSPSRACSVAHGTNATTTIPSSVSMDVPPVLETPAGGRSEIGSTRNRMEIRAAVRAGLEPRGLGALARAEQHELVWRRARDPAAGRQAVGAVRRVDIHAVALHAEVAPG